MKTIILLIMSVFALTLVSVAWCNNADMNQDGMVDVGDLGIFSFNFNATCSLDNPAYNLSSEVYDPCCNQTSDLFACCDLNNYCNGSDLNRDGLVGDVGDLAIFNVNWNSTNCSDEIIVEPIPDPVPETMPVSSGGGSGCDTTWNCSSWNTCINGQQNRTCEKLRYSCDAGKKPELNQSCNIPKAVTIVEPEPQEQVVEQETVPEIQETQSWNRWLLILGIIGFVIIIVIVLQSIRLLAKGKENNQRREK